MHLALMQAKKALGNTKGNPSVGCIIVKNNSVIGADCTGINGRPHAEEKAISKLNKNNKKLNVFYIFNFEVFCACWSRYFN